MPSKNKKFVYLDIEEAIGRFLGVESSPDDMTLLELLEADVNKFNVWFEQFDIDAPLSDEEIDEKTTALFSFCSNQDYIDSVSRAIDENRSDDLNVLLRIYECGDNMLLDHACDVDLKDLRYQVAVRVEVCEARLNLANDLLHDIDLDIAKDDSVIVINEAKQIEETSFNRWARKRYGTKLEAFSPEWRKKELQVLSNATKETLLTIVALTPLLLAQANPEQYRHAMGKDSKGRIRAKQGTPNINLITKAFEVLDKQYADNLSVKRVSAVINDAKHTMLIDY
jgi:hypothetical protein